MNLKRLHLLFLLIVLPAGGCGAGIFAPDDAPPPTPLGEIDTARLAYVGALNALSPLLEAKIIRDEDTLLVLKSVRERIPVELDAAEAYARTGNLRSFRYYLDRAKAAIETLKTINAASGGTKVVLCPSSLPPPSCSPKSSPGSSSSPT